MASAARRNNRFVIMVTAITIVVIAALIVTVVWVNAAATARPSEPSGDRFNSSSGAFIVGNKAAPARVTTYIDFMCPGCNAFETNFGDSLNKLASDGKITLELMPVAILDAQSQGTRYSTRAGNAFYCVATSSPDAAPAFVKAMFANQPQEGTNGLTDQQIQQIATSAGAGDLSACMSADKDGKLKYEDQVAWATRNMPPNPADGKRGTPTITVDGKYLAMTEFSGKPNYFTDRFGK